MISDGCSNANGKVLDKIISHLRRQHTTTDIRALDTLSR
jgi:hypothetical protein